VGTSPDSFFDGKGLNRRHRCTGRRWHGNTSDVHRITDRREWPPGHGSHPRSLLCIASGSPHGRTDLCSFAWRWLSRFRRH
jgi:hypothetical protein